ncbi:LAETG motif-containing sortase-dependent surface protein [Streptomyces sp. NPDC088725]|uniref:LAETG motif-containing sortase-dependent surface protein n=1 Tax=Streptomyces sp. NPDC088725 TaxID=3365873 RepID=UPI0037F4CB18
MTVFNRSLRRPGALIAVAAAGVLGVGLSAGTASAHTPTWSIDCSSVSVDLTAYGHGNDKVNSVSLTTADGVELLNEKFGDQLHKKIDLPEHYTPLAVHLSVKAADGDRYSTEDDKTSPVCEGQTPPPSEEPTPSPSAPSEEPSEEPSEQPSEQPSDSPSAAPSSEPSSSAAVPPASSAPSPAGDLAETGSSSNTPMIAGGAAVVLVAGAGILWASRKRRAVQH